MYSEATSSRRSWPGSSEELLTGGWAGATKILTKAGCRAIRELCDGKQHQVLGRDACWHDVTFAPCGAGPVLSVVVGRNRQTKILQAAPGQSWLLRTGPSRKQRALVPTGHLKEGDRLAVVFPRNGVRQTTPSPFGIAHGITFGDGTLNGTGSMAQLDPAKDRPLLKWFSNSVVTETRAPHQLLVHHLPRFFKSLPPMQESVPYLYGWLAGYLAADGHVAKDGTVMLNCAKREILEYVRTVSTRLGIGTYGITEQVREGFPGRLPSSIFRVHFVTEDLSPAFFLLEEHRRRFEVSSKAFSRKGWVVRDVRGPVDGRKDLFSISPEGHGEWALEDNILVARLPK
ncbi:LAGLIDADG family homing endonuclease [Actinomadura rupiterrae]|uniref:LAGLIDADG family homing endonuclease n=1 Tax=Actinomadura rupiterrae TaxID=559627 RepID=UPI0020A3C849|nr:LAGLIDADG family homing endonuclease [Actinomadura rupiterrae]MCP2338740.1 hypothetical protein [Actinomadura rupiterrae]